MHLWIGILAAVFQAPPGPEPARVVRQYAPLLADERHALRARDLLVHAGEPALALLERQGADPSLLRDLREEAAVLQGLGDVYRPPRRFTFDGQEETLGHYLGRLEEAAGITFQKQTVDLSRQVAPSVKDASFWETLDVLCRQAQVLYYPSAVDQLYLNPGILPDKPKSFYGPFMITLDRFLLRRRVLFSRTETQFTARIHCVWEPSLAPLGLSPDGVRFTRAADGQGRSALLPADGAAPPPPASTGGGPLLFEFVDAGGIRLPEGPRPRFAVLEGSLRLEFPSRILTASFSGPLEAAPAARALEDVAVELRSCAARGGSQVTADLALLFPDEKTAAAYRLSPRSLSFRDASGRRLPAYLQGSRLERNALLFTARCYGLTQAADLKEISVAVPRGRVPVEVPFRFADLEVK
jgi:hypothetical protein